MRIDIGRGGCMAWDGVLVSVLERLMVSFLLVNNDGDAIAEDQVIHRNYLEAIFEFEH